MDNIVFFGVDNLNHLFNDGEREYDDVILKYCIQGSRICLKFESEADDLTIEDFVLFTVSKLNCPYIRRCKSKEDTDETFIDARLPGTSLINWLDSHQVDLIWKDINITDNIKWETLVVNHPYLRRGGPVSSNYKINHAYFAVANITHRTKEFGSIFYTDGLHPEMLGVDWIEITKTVDEYDLLEVHKNKNRWEYVPASKIIVFRDNNLSYIWLKNLQNDYEIIENHINKDKYFKISVAADGSGWIYSKYCNEIVDCSWNVEMQPVKWNFNKSKIYKYSIVNGCFINECVKKFKIRMIPCNLYQKDGVNAFCYFKSGIRNETNVRFFYKM